MDPTFWMELMFHGHSTVIMPCYQLKMFSSSHPTSLGFRKELAVVSHLDDGTWALSAEESLPGEWSGPGNLRSKPFGFSRVP